MTDYISVYMTARDKLEAEMIAEQLIRDKLAACVNIFQNVQSTYHWQGRVETSEEVVFIAKTHRDLFDELRERVRGLHSYSCPCIVAWPIEAGDQDYLNWLRDQLK